MNVVVKKVGGREYAYLAVREGKRVFHKYLGSIDNPRVMRILRDKKEASAIPEQFRSLFWDTSLSNIHIRRNARYIIERVLEFGNMDAVNWLERVYPVQTIIDVLQLSRGITEKSRNFWMVWFGVSDA